MVRLSAKENFTVYPRRNLVVTVDGVKVPSCFDADEEEGWAKYYMFHPDEVELPNSEFIMTSWYDGPSYYIIRGNVEISLTDAERRMITALRIKSEREQHEL